ncbi:MAG TPA: sigma-70 family RNA polymerase sigma factor [Phycisphaerales bacterium]|nr:sigma-70 family RNA polymerase sigma factor [Phycisphaerales bacterium]
MTPRAERKLIRRVLDGDRAAAEELVRTHQGSLYGYMLRLSGRPDVAEDVVQEAFVRALSNLHRYDERFRFSTWLFTIAKRLYVNARQRLAPSYDTEAMGAAADRKSFAAGEGEETGGHFAASGELQSALGCLSPDQREAVVLFYQLEWSVEQIGEHLEVPVGTVKSHLHRARARLRAALESQPAVSAWMRGLGAREVPA